MDIPRTESSSSFFFHPHKSSSPIEIPGRHHHDDPVPPTSTRPFSPEPLIFEMESLDCPSTRYSFGLSTSCTTDDREPLLYPFPVFSASHLIADRRTHPAPRSTAGASASLPPPIAHNAPATRKTHRRTRTLQLNSPRQTPTVLDPTHAIRAVPLHKITGFKPESAAQAPEPRPPIKRAPREKPLAPPPRSSNFLPSPWLLPSARGDVSDDEPRSLELDPSAVDFTQYLLRRIDSQKPLQFQTFQAMMSVSVR
ncbi:hypothetical protein C8R44DRAFT_422726 [Mycena epipterygia]|nr:hypothetical protein C8R44DRAFT_422726 [Mycena epipterygia]